MGSFFCCDSNAARQYTEECSEISIRCIEAVTITIDKSLSAYPFRDINTEIIENTSERQSFNFN